MGTCGQTITASLCCSLCHFPLLRFLVSPQATGESLFQCLQHILPSFFDLGVCRIVSHAFFLIPLFASVSFHPFLNTFFLRCCILTAGPSRALQQSCYFVYWLKISLEKYFDQKGGGAWISQSGWGFFTCQEKFSLLTGHLFIFIIGSALWNPCNDPCRIIIVTE